jgi:hypothetical protein
MGASGEDILLSPAARRIAPISIECKSREKIAVYGYYEQAQQNAQGYQPAVFIKQNRASPLVVIDAEYFIDLLRRAK